MPKQMFVQLSHAPNPDVTGGYWGQKPPPPKEEKFVEVGSLAQAREVCMDFIAEYELGGGNWTGGAVYLDGQNIAQISYNGRIWKPDLSEEILIPDYEAMLYQFDKERVKDIYQKIDANGFELVDEIIENGEMTDDKYSWISLLRENLKYWAEEEGCSRHEILERVASDNPVFFASKKEKEIDGLRL